MRVLGLQPVPRGRAHGSPDGRSLLEIESLDAVEFFPGPNLPGGGDPHWLDLYRKIKAAGKAVQVVLVRPQELEPLLDAVGSAGTYVTVDCYDEATIESVARTVELSRSS